MITLKLNITAKNREEFIEFFEEALKQAKEGDASIAVGGMTTGAEGNIHDTEEQKAYWSKEAGYELTDNQVRFCMDAEDEGLDVDFTYSGRGMYGKLCPSVDMERGDDPFNTTAKTKQDSMGLGYVVYAQY